MTEPATISSVKFTTLNAAAYDQLMARWSRRLARRSSSQGSRTSFSDLAMRDLDQSTSARKARGRVLDPLRQHLGRVGIADSGRPNGAIMLRTMAWGDLAWKDQPVNGWGEMSSLSAQWIVSGCRDDDASRTERRFTS